MTLSVALFFWLEEEEERERLRPDVLAEEKGRNQYTGEDPPPPHHSPLVRATPAELHLRHRISSSLFYMRCHTQIERKKMESTGSFFYSPVLVTMAKRMLSVSIPATAAIRLYVYPPLTGMMDRLGSDFGPNRWWWCLLYEPYKSNCLLASLFFFLYLWHRCVMRLTPNAIDPLVL